MAAACAYSILSSHEGQIPDLITPTERSWLALVVRSRHEKSVKTLLDSKGYRTAVPLVRCIHRRRSGSAWDSQKPLIAGYVFAVYDRDNPFRIVTTPGVVQIVSFGSQPGTIPEAEIESLERIAASGLPVAGCGYTRVGEKVELIGGPLKGVQGIVLREAKSTRLIVGVELLQRAVAVEIEGAWAVPTRYISGASSFSSNSIRF
jgi:transcription termination/antitermination protein NusG